MSRNEGKNRPSVIYGSRQRIGGLVKQRRLTLGLSLRAAARSAEVSSSHLSRIERGTALTSYQILQKLTAVLGMDEAALRREEDAVMAVDRRLDVWWGRIGLTDEQRRDLLRLSPATRAALVVALDRLGPSDEPSSEVTSSARRRADVRQPRPP